MSGTPIPSSKKYHPNEAVQHFTAKYARMTPLTPRCGGFYLFQKGLAMTEMHITKIADDGYHEIKDRFIDEEVSGSQFLGIASERTSPMGAAEILRLMDSQYVGYAMTVDYD